MAVARLEIPRWRPALANELLRGHWSRAHRLKRRDRDMVAAYALLRGIPAATGRRRVSLEIAGPWRGRTPDPDAPLKSALDALVASGMLVDDSPRWCELGPVAFRRAPEYGTAIVLEDLGPAA